MKCIRKASKNSFVYLKHNYCYWLKNKKLSNTLKTVVYYRYNSKKLTHLFKYKK